jgi:hypothetical protein
MKILLLFFILLVKYNMINANEVGSGLIEKSIRPQARQNNLKTSADTGNRPKCFEETSELNASKNPEDVIKTMFKDLSDEEIQTRLILAETYASSGLGHLEQI